MSTDRESPNPFESPQTVATGEAKPPPRELGSRLRDLRYQIIGFAVLFFTGLVAVFVAIGLFSFANDLTLSPRWDWLDTAMRIAGVLIGVAGFPIAIVCGPWTLWCVVQFGLVWYSGRGPGEEDNT